MGTIPNAESNQFILMGVLVDGITTKAFLVDADGKTISKP